MANLVTQKDIARLTGLSQPTVSLALRNDPRVNEQTRQQVMQATRQLGYQKDPMLTALASYRGDRQQHTYRGTLAWLNDPDVYALEDYDDSVWHHYRDDAERQALQHGYKLDVLEVDMRASSHQRVSDILFNRGIEGIILPPLRHVGPAPKLEWRNFCTVTFCWTVMDPRFHSVSPNHYYNSFELARNFKALGYQRIAAVLLVPPEDLDKKHIQLWEHGIQSAAATLIRQEPIPALRLSSTDADQAKQVQGWFRAHRPDAIAVMRECAPFVEDALRQTKILAPRDVGIANFARLQQDDHYAGIDENDSCIAEAAVDVLVGAIRRREFGSPPVRRMVQIEGFWKDGKSLQKRRRKSG
ncbi:LacI family DNA-binding transcriptional regulator [Ruficoccus sp. ZRK36]|uniref:LacI family DNA-binding transcriptional regulator n=1 Tax=Ruficoccus sp. ZRK36 TaxID=2866311 RepID=UPI001C73274E|nr:LacI family DNA-binding transcriptional regulator [Ruficoccus sp. ZRK36]QYY35204.1 LacI family transcriptional regulator [Ruficoccus sp. ZRK36]